MPLMACTGLLQRYNIIDSRSFYVAHDSCIMWKTTTVLFLVTCGIAIFLQSSPTDVPDLPETFWGPEKNKEASKEVRPFAINVKQPVIDDLNERLANRRELREPLEGTAWTYGISTTYLKDVLEYWRTKYNWTERAALLNKYPQYMTNIQGLDIHFYHVKPQIPAERKNIKVYPLLIMHGWAGSVVEFQKIIPMLTTPRADKHFVFEVIAPSLPGFGFSQAAVRPGLATPQIAVIFKNLMLRLGFNQFYIQGGDWGSVVASHLGAFFPDNILGSHMNLCIVLSKSNMLWRLIGALIPSLVVESKYADRMYPLGHYMSFFLEESGYFHIQATKPDTIGTAVSASPVALAAYILEKFSTLTNPEYRLRQDGGLLEKFTLDELLDNLMLYWVTNSLTTSVRLYSEQFTKAYIASRIDELPVEVPVACAVFPHEIVYTPESLLRKKYINLIQMNHLPRGGHFAALEEPALLADDIFKFVHTVEETKRKNIAKNMPNKEKKIKVPTKI
ncbi:juvenile hormone epoxide hydrolase 1-like isoform X1 [Solenopsis invicta]|uniref:juvenile hormone epoxide hydrolase 1-like isoform X1 n=1 Tax=Solenopsis invicta TaxID=13686 RepID=UPI00193DD1F0|nr:juvenile hormone epoxide hydrolase 1-like isoform X1 [Solenopsis invicta]